MKLLKTISFNALRRIQKNCLFLPLILAVVILTAALQDTAVSAQGRPEMVSMHGVHDNFAAAVQQDPAMEAFVTKHSKGAKKRRPDGSVQVVYLVPADKARQRKYAAALKDAIREIQAFYQEELGISRSKGRTSVGETFKTFKTFKRTVEVVVTPHDSAYYNANNQAGPSEFFFRAVEDGFEATAAVSTILTLCGSITLTQIRLAARE